MSTASNVQQRIIDPRFLTLAQLLERRLFRIPEYQRAYSWTRRQREDLFDDIRSALAHHSALGHFMATVVVLERGRSMIFADEYQVVDVVDGQQRLTTLVVLFRALSRALSDDQPGHERVRRQIDELLVKGDELSLLLLQTNHDTSRFFVDYLRHGTVPNKAAAHTSAERALAECIIDCEKFVATFTTDELVPLLVTLKNRLTFIVHEIANEATVYTVFEVLNSRGLPVSWVDRLKSMLMAIAFASPGGNASEHLAELHGIWRQIYRSLGMLASGGGEAMRFAAVLQTGKCRRGRLLAEEDAARELRAECRGKVQRAVETSLWLQRVVDALMKLKANARLGAVTRMAQARFVAVAVELCGWSEREKEAVLQQWESTTFRVFGVARRDARTLSGRFIALGLAIFRGMSPPEAIHTLHALGQHHCPDAAIPRHLRGQNCYEGWTSELRYLMCRYEEHLAGQAGETLNEEIWERIWHSRDDHTIEHIFPRSRASDDSPIDGGAVHRLGNLVVLPPGINSSLSDKPFEEKRRVYQESGLYCVRELARYDQWTRAELEEREERIIAWLTAALSAPPPAP